MLNVFINDLETECSPIEFADDTKTEGAVHMLEGTLPLRRLLRRRSRDVYGGAQQGNKRQWSYIESGEVQAGYKEKKSP